MRLATMASLLGLLLGVRPGSAQAVPFTPAAALGQVQALGADSAFSLFYADSTGWSRLTGHLAAGDTTWFPVADALESARSIHARGLKELDDAVVSSLAVQPAALFSYELGQGLTAAQIAESYCVPLPDAPQGAMEYLQAAINAVEGLKVPALKSARDACLGAFRRLQP